MKKISVFALSFFLLLTTLHAQEPVTVGGAPMYAKKNIVENAVNSKDHTTLVAAVKAAGLVDVLQTDGPFTVFAPTNDAFEKLPTGTVDNLLKPENKTQLQNILKYHVVSGNWTAAQLRKMIAENNGKATITTLQGGKIYASADEKGGIWLWDENGGKAAVSIADVHQKNGVIHVVDGVLLHKM
ncbi:fasciclin domain-containing protein [Flavisolibacter sp. BT320]|nr:fasciclin domain-containing protein [Flavisolibacter longurius]